VLDLTVSNPTNARLAVPTLGERGRLALSHEDVALYEPLPFGLPDTRAAIAEGYAALGEQVSADDVICTASTSEAYAWLFSILADPGDAVFVPVPSYPLFSYLAAYQSVRLLPYPLRYDGAWHVDLPELRRRVSNEPRARAILAVSPNNPTGSTTKADELGATKSSRAIPSAIRVGASRARSRRGRVSRSRSRASPKKRRSPK
jgi:aspartate/methionine/tyrosine aminotransferase